MLKKIYFAFVSILITLPVFASALLTNTKMLAEDVFSIVDYLIPMAFSLAVVFFFYGVAKYIWSEGEGKGEGKKIMIWGVVALFVMSSVWGIIYYIEGELNIVGSERTMPIPKATYN